jgi:hypothetical protein
MITPVAHIVFASNPVSSLFSSCVLVNDYIAINVLLTVFAFQPPGQDLKMEYSYQRCTQRLCVCSVSIHVFLFYFEIM